MHISTHTNTHTHITNMHACIEGLFSAPAAGTQLLRKGTFYSRVVKASDHPLVPEYRLGALEELGGGTCANIRSHI